MRRIEASRKNASPVAAIIGLILAAIGKVGQYLGILIKKVVWLGKREMAC